MELELMQRVYPTRFKTLCLIHSATPSAWLKARSNQLSSETGLAALSEVMRAMNGVLILVCFTLDDLVFFCIVSCFQLLKNENSPDPEIVKCYVYCRHVIRHQNTSSYPTNLFGW